MNTGRRGYLGKLWSVCDNWQSRKVDPLSDSSKRQCRQLPHKPTPSGNDGGFPEGIPLLSILFGGTYGFRRGWRGFRFSEMGFVQGNVNFDFVRNNFLGLLGPRSIRFDHEGVLESTDITKVAEIGFPGHVLFPH